MGTMVLFESLPPNKKIHTSARYSGPLCASAGNNPNGRNASDPTEPAATRTNPRRVNMAISFY
jgi:hypothetical protein